MKETWKDILKTEFIGESVSIKEADNQSLVGLEGKIIDETKETFVIETVSGRKTILKKQIKFIIEKEGKKIKIDGKKLCFRPEDRVKKIR